MINLGMVVPGSTILIPFNAFDSNDPSASVIVSDFALADIGIYKGTSMTERGSTTGVVLLDTDGINIDGATGIHGFSIDLSSNATAGFYAAGSNYYVTVGPITVDGATLNFAAATFSIGYPGAILNTTVAAYTSINDFTLTAASIDDDAYNGCRIVFHDVASAVQMQWGIVEDYTGSGSHVNLLADPGIFTLTAADNVSIFMPALTATGNGTTVGTSLDVNTDGTVPWNAAWDAEVQSEVNDALVALSLDHLIAVADADDVVDDSVIAKLANSGATADWSAYVNTTDSLMAIRDHIADGTNLTEAGGDGDHLTAINLPNQTMNIIGNITGNLSGSIGSNLELGPAEVNAEVDTALAGTDYAEHSAASDFAATATLEEKITFLYMLARNRITQTATTTLLKADDESTTVGTSTVSDDGTTFIRQEFT